MGKLFLLLLLISANVCIAATAPAAATTTPQKPAVSTTVKETECVPVKLKTQGNYIILPGPDQARTGKLYFFKNVSQQSLWLDHPVGRVSASAGWSSYLRTGNWAAMMLTRKNFAVSCSVINPGKVDELECVKAISVCVAKSTDTVPNQKSTYWLAEDKSWDDLVKAMTRRGVHF
jgi:hypothetical protein